MVFPVDGGAHYVDSFGAGRSGGRSHEGQDLMAPKHTRAVAAVDGTVVRVRHSLTGLSGNSLTIRDADGWTYTYIHLNNDTPGTDDGSNRYELAFADGIRAGQRVRAGETVGWVGDSGNAESTAPHLHFELHAPDGGLVNAYPSLRAAAARSMSGAEMAAVAPFGHLDGLVKTGAGTVRIAGWAIDHAVDGPIDVSIYYDGNPILTAPADGRRDDVGAAFPGRGVRHGFDLPVVGIPAGTHRLCIVAHNAAAGGSTRLGCADVTF
jgi:murein DD-endopeptidase MepM/ murein hydrolase activator NlpD